MVQFQSKKWECDSLRAVQIDCRISKLTTHVSMPDTLHPRSKQGCKTHNIIRTELTHAARYEMTCDVSESPSHSQIHRIPTSLLRSVIINSFLRLAHMSEKEKSVLLNRRSFKMFITQHYISKLGTVDTFGPTIKTLSSWVSKICYPKICRRPWTLYVVLCAVCL